MGLSTNQHADFLKKIDNLDVVGCFCFTELGYGNNAPKMETTAIYDDKTKEFIINCPTPLS
jgi:acyl-CoA oxidase